VDATVEIGVQINGKVKSVIAVGADDSKEQILEKSLADPKTAAALEGMQIVKTIVIPGRIVNIVVKPA
jgi:leucyl-tRNA synthetase